MTPISAFFELVVVALRNATPLVWCGLGILLAERAGVMNIGAEGMMLAGAFVGGIAAIFSQSGIVGIACAMVIGGILGAMLAGLTVLLPGDQIIAGLALNYIVLGFTSFASKLLPGAGAGLRTPSIGFWVFLMAAVIFATGLWFLLFKTRTGLCLRALGENAYVVYTIGFSPHKQRLQILIISGILCGFAGSSLTLGWLKSIADNITLGRGFIALAAVYLGRWHPLGLLLACVLFGLGEAVVFRYSHRIGIINEFYFMMFPYLLSFIVVALFKKGAGPADVGKPFVLSK